MDLRPPSKSVLLDTGRWLLRWPGWFIALFLAAQLALPLHYYQAHRDDHDERFAWSMFSPIRMVRCDLTMTVDDQPVNLKRRPHCGSLAQSRYWIEHKSAQTYHSFNVHGQQMRKPDLATPDSPPATKSSPIGTTQMSDRNCLVFSQSACRLGNPQMKQPTQCCSTLGAAASGA